MTNNHVIDLNSAYSGVSSLVDAKYDFEGIRALLFKHIDQDTIIIGHG